MRCVVPGLEISAKQDRRCSLSADHGWKPSTGPSQSLPPRRGRSCSRLCCSPSVGRFPSGPEVIPVSLRNRHRQSEHEQPEDGCLRSRAPPSLSECAYCAKAGDIRRPGPCCHDCLLSSRHGPHGPCQAILASLLKISGLSPLLGFGRSCSCSCGSPPVGRSSQGPEVIPVPLRNDDGARRARTCCTVTVCTALGARALSQRKCSARHMSTGRGFIDRAIQKSSPSFPSPPPLPPHAPRRR